MNAVAKAVAEPAARFTKIGADGLDLPADAEKWEAVRDSRSGLIWAVESKKVSHWNKAEAAAKRIKAAGFTEWRLPTVEELFLLADRSRTSPTIDTDFFPKCKSDWYWSSTPAASSPGGYAWSVYFYDGSAYWDSQVLSGFVRAVRPSQ